MNVDEFVRETILQVARGVREANDQLLAENGKDSKSERTFFLRPGAQKDQGTGIDFDIAVTTKASGDAKASAKLRLTVVEADLGGGGGLSKESVSRIRFTVAVGQWVG